VVSLARARPRRLVLVGRSRERIQPVIDDVKRVNAKIAVDFVSIDLSDNTSVRAAAQEIQTITDEIHGLVNNAAIMAPEDFGTNGIGIERQFATNYLGHFLLTNLLKSQLVLGQGVVNNVSSRGHMVGPIDFEDINFQVMGEFLTTRPNC
jgi:NAD(P)-dependent dehydrogenase (short-subunit alcohol dehydrogenase family)